MNSSRGFWSDRHLRVKVLIPWLLLALCALYGILANDDHVPPDVKDFQREPTRFAGETLVFSYVLVDPPISGNLPLMQTAFGPVPVRIAPFRLEPHEIYSLRVRWNPDTSMTLLEAWHHPLRRMKAGVSSMVSVLLVIAVLYRYGRTLKCTL